jgi:hypothetical protein
MGKEKNVFISHYNKDDEHIGNLKDLLARKGYTIKNGSIDSSKPNRVISDEAIKRLLRLRINWAGTFICLIGKDTHTRPWVDWEIEQAKAKGKTIIGVKVFGEGYAALPKNFEKYGDCLTGWNSDKIIDALEGHDIGWSDPSGTTSSSSHSVITVSC